MATGTSEVCLPPIKLKDASNATYEARAKWKRIGTQLELSSGDLEAISKENQKTGDKLTAVLDLWIRNSEEAKWSVLVEALRSPTVGYAKLAQTISKKYCHQDALTTFQNKATQCSIENLLVSVVARVNVCDKAIQCSIDSEESLPKSRHSSLTKAKPTRVAERIRRESGLIDRPW